MTVEFASILPPNSTGWEKAVEQVSGERWDQLDADVIRRYKDPMLCPEHLLNFLAYERSIDIWDESWPVELKRNVIAQAYRLHALKGTEAGIENYLRLAGAKLTKVVAPPSKTYLMPGMSAQERQNWLNRFPQLRIYPFAERSQQQFKTFTTAANGRSKHFMGEGFPFDCATYSRYGRRAKLYEPRDGSITDLTVRSIKMTTTEGKAVDVEQVILPVKPSKSFFLNSGAKARIFLVNSDTIAKRVVTLHTEKAYSYRVGQSQYTTVAPSWEAIDVRPEGIAERGSRNGAQLFPSKGEILHKKFMVPSTAWQRIYERIFLHDPTRLPDQRPRGVYMGHTRLGMPAFHAELTVEIRGKRPKRAVGRFVFGFFVKADQTPLNKALDALRSSKALRDTIQINTKTKRTIRAGDPMKVGAVRVGELISA